MVKNKIKTQSSVNWYQQIQSFTPIVLKSDLLAGPAHSVHSDLNDTLQQNGHDVS